MLVTPINAQTPTNTERKCDRVNNRINQQITNAQNRINTRDKQALKMTQKYQKILDKAKDKNIDTSKLQTDLNLLKNTIDKDNSDWKADYYGLINTLKTAQKLPCDSDQFKTAMKTAKDQQQKIKLNTKKDMQNVKDTRETINNDVKALREELKTK